MPPKEAAFDYAMSQPYEIVTNREEHETEILQKAFLAGVQYAADKMEEALPDTFSEAKAEALRDIERENAAM